MLRHVCDTELPLLLSTPLWSAQSVHSDQGMGSFLCEVLVVGFFFLYFTLQGYSKAPQFDSIHPYVFLIEKINKLEPDYHHHTDSAVKPHIYRLLADPLQQ